MKYHITITNNETGDVFFDGDTSGLVANIIEGNSKIKTITLIKTDSVNTARLCHRTILSAGDILSSQEELMPIFSALMKETMDDLDDEDDNETEEETKTYVE